jgi:hypothetical protein
MCLGLGESYAEEGTHRTPVGAVSGLMFTHYHELVRPHAPA